MHDIAWRIGTSIKLLIATATFPTQKKLGLIIIIIMIENKIEENKNKSFAKKQEN